MYNRMVHFDIFWIQYILLATLAVYLHAKQQPISVSKQQQREYVVFYTSGTFRVPNGVHRVRVLTVGGGSGGLSGHLGGGGSGYVRSGEFDVTPGEVVLVAVGTGGVGSSYKIGTMKQNSKAGGTSSFGAYLSAAGGEGTNGEGIYSGAEGGSGGGAGAYRILYGCPNVTSGAGGTDGSDGLNINGTGCNSYGVGSGQGSFSQQLKLFTRNRLTPGAGGSGRSTANPYYGGGGGGGGVLLNSSGPTAQAGADSKTGGFGGSGFGGGGGAGGFLYQGLTFFYAGGRGADGLVYIEW